MKTKMMILLAACSFALSMNTSAQTMPGEIAGQITDETGNPLAYAAISYLVNGSLQGATADENGRYRIKPLDAGKYEVSYYLLGYKKATYSDIQVNSGQITSLSVKLSVSDGYIITEVPIIHHKGLFEPDITFIGDIFDEEELDHIPVSTFLDIVALTPGANQSDDGKDINIRGSRSDATQYYVDGVKMIGGFSIPKSSIKEINVITGGVPAMFGDATGGIVLITTKSYWDYNRPQPETPPQAAEPVAKPN